MLLHQKLLFINQYSSISGLRYDFDNDIVKEIATFKLNCVIKRSTWSKKTNKDRQINFYKAIVGPILLYGFKNCVAM